MCTPNSTLKHEVFNVNAADQRYLFYVKTWTRTDRIAGHRTIRDKKKYVDSTRKSFYLFFLFVSLFVIVILCNLSYPETVISSNNTKIYSSQTEEKNTIVFRLSEKKLLVLMWLDNKVEKWEK